MGTDACSCTCQRVSRQRHLSCSKGHSVLRGMMSLGWILPGGTLYCVSKALSSPGKKKRLVLWACWLGAPSLSWSIPRELTSTWPSGLHSPTISTISNDAYAVHCQKVLGTSPTAIPQNGRGATKPLLGSTRRLLSTPIWFKKTSREILYSNCLGRDIALESNCSPQTLGNSLFPLQSL